MNAVKFVSYNGEGHRVLIENQDGGLWLIPFEQPAQPFFCIEGGGLTRVPTPDGFQVTAQQELTPAQ